LTPREDCGVVAVKPSTNGVGTNANECLFEPCILAHALEISVKFNTRGITRGCQQFKPFDDGSTTWFCDAESASCERRTRVSSSGRYLGIRWANRWNGGHEDMCEKCVMANASGAPEGPEAAQAQKNAASALGVASMMESLPEAPTIERVQVYERRQPSCKFEVMCPPNTARMQISFDERCGTDASTGHPVGCTVTMQRRSPNRCHVLEDDILSRKSQAPKLGLPWRSAPWQAAHACAIRGRGAPARLTSFTLDKTLSCTMTYSDKGVELRNFSASRDPPSSNHSAFRAVVSAFVSIQVRIPFCTDHVACCTPSLHAVMPLIDPVMSRYRPRSSTPPICCKQHLAVASLTTLLTSCASTRLIRKVMSRPQTSLRLPKRRF
jgi:hypothetical protein